MGFHIVDLGEWDEQDAAFWAKLERTDQHNRRHDPCEDDVEMTAPYIGILPDESNTENGSPLEFGAKAFERDYLLCLKLGMM